MKNQKLKKGLALFLTAALTIGVLPTYPGNAENIKAAESGSGPRITAFATKKQLMENFELDGEEDTVGRIVFGKNESNSPQKWYIAGRDRGITGENVVLFAESPLKEEQVFNKNSENEDYSSNWGCMYDDGFTPTEVYANHYGASDLRAALKEMEKNSNYFTAAEQTLMNNTTLYTNDDCNDKSYKVIDKLYALSLYGYGTVCAGGVGSSSIAVGEDYFWENGGVWTRGYYQPNLPDMVSILDKRSTNAGYVKEELAVQPAFNLNLSSVLFASSVPTPTVSSEKVGTLYGDNAMTLRLDGSGKPIGSAVNSKDFIIARKANNAGTVSLVVQGDDWYYRTEIDGNTTISLEDLKFQSTYVDVTSFEECEIWVETVENGLIYANRATNETIHTINEIEVTDITAPVGGIAFDTKAKCSAAGITTTEPSVTYINLKNNSQVTEGKAEWSTEYDACVTLTTDIKNNYVLSEGLTVKINGEKASVTKNSDGSITVSYRFSTGKKKITSIAAPLLPGNNTFTNYYTEENVKTSSELGTEAMVTFEDKTTKSMSVVWSLNGEYNTTPGAENKFDWTIHTAQYENEYDLNGQNPSGTVVIKNSAASPVAVTGTDAAVNYTGEAIDVSQYFTIGENAGAPTYTLVTGEGEEAGEGTLAGTVLTVTKTGTFVIRLNTAANGNYGAGEATAILNVGEGVIENSATDYSGAYDGQPHGIVVAVVQAENATITYSADGTTYSTSNPQYIDVGTYTVHYKIEKPYHTTVTGSKTVTIHPKDITITAADQNLVWGTEVDKSKYTVAEGALIAGHQVSQVTLTSSTTEFTDNGIVAANDAKIVNAEGKDVTANYNISYVNGKLVIKHNTILAPTDLAVAKTTTAYTAGAAMTVNDLTVKVTYPDGYVETVTDYKTNADSIDMTTAGDKTLTVSFTRNGKTLTKDIRITVSPAPVVKHKVTVNSGTGDGEYQVGQTVTITADAAPAGKQFKGWVIVSGGITLAGSTSATTTFKMPANAVEVTAAYEDVKAAEPEEETKKPATKEETKKTTTVEVEIPKTGVEVTVAVVLAKGTTFVDAGNKATYKVMGDGSVEYVKPVKKMRRP